MLSPPLTLQRMYGGLLSSAIEIDMWSGFFKTSSVFALTVTISVRSFFALNPRCVRSLFLNSRPFCLISSGLMSFINAAKSNVSERPETRTIRSEEEPNGSWVPSSKVGGATKISFELSATLVSSGYFNEWPFEDSSSWDENSFDSKLQFCNHSLIAAAGIA